MDVTNLTSLINALRAETAYAAITPESLGSLLLKMAEAIGQSSSNNDVTPIRNWKTAIQKINEVITSFEQGSTDRNNIYLSTQLANLANGETATLADAIVIKQATTERAGAMRAQQVIDLNGCKSDIKTLQKDMAALSNQSNQSNQGGTFNIVCYAKGNNLYVTHARELIKAGYEPFLFRYSSKRNRLTNYRDPDADAYHGPRKKGWNILYGEDVIRIDADDSVLFSQFSETHKPTSQYNNDVRGVMCVGVYLDDNDDAEEVDVAWGQRMVKCAYGHRFKFGIGFAPHQPTRRFNMESLVTNIAPFHVYVGINRRTKKCEVNLSL